MTLAVQQKPCWEVVCDVCGEGDNVDYGGSFHYHTEAEARDMLKSADWMIREDGKAMCGTCADELYDRVACPDCESPLGSKCADPHGGRALRSCPARYDAAMEAL